jgi:hypothetical protein
MAGLPDAALDHDPEFAGARTGATLQVYEA